jgi:GntR family transcriptional regulator / MocR family aminotransferase
MTLHISLTGRGDLSQRIYRQIIEAVIDGRLRVGDRLPPSRLLAEQLSVARHTVTVAYERLTAEGFLDGRVGAGTFVAPDAVRTIEPRGAPRGAALQPGPKWRDLVVPVQSGQTTPRFDFRVGIPDGSLFPADVWRRLYARCSLEAHTGRYGDPAGEPRLRTAVARHAAMARSLRAGADDVIITHGAQQALDLIGRVLIEPGDLVAVEEPGYPPARQLFASIGAEVVPVAVDNEGIVVSALPAGARLVYVTPSHQFPLGTPMSLRRRLALLAWVEQSGAAVIEDDYDTEFRFGDRPLDPLQSLDRSGRVVYVGTFAKTLVPSLRLGFVVAPPTLVPALRAARYLSDSHGDPAMQATLAQLIEDGRFARHVRRAGSVYAERHRVVKRTLADLLAPWLTVVPSVAGIHVCARVAHHLDLDRVVIEAARRGVAVDRLADYCAGPRQQGLVIGYGAIATGLIEEGLTVLAGCFPAEQPLG